MYCLITTVFIFNLVCFDVMRRDDLRKLLLQPPEEQKEGEEGEGAEPEEEVVYKYIPPEPKEWVSQGSEKEILEENVMETRGKVGSLHKFSPPWIAYQSSLPPLPPPPPILNNNVHLSCAHQHPECSHDTN